MSFDAALQFANDLYLRHRRDFHPSRTDSSIDPRMVEKNRRSSFFDHLHAERLWKRRHQ